MSLTNGAPARPADPRGSSQAAARSRFSPVRGERAVTAPPCAWGNRGSVGRSHCPGPHRRPVRPGHDATLTPEAQRHHLPCWGLWSSEFWVPRGAAGPHPEVPWKVRPGASPLPEETPIPQEPGLCGLRTLTGRGGGAGGQGRGEGRRGRGGGEQEDISPRRGGARSPRPSSELVCAARAAGAHPLRSKGPGRRHGQAHGALALPASFSLWKTRILENLGESGTPGLHASTARSAARGAEGPAPQVPGGQGRGGGVA